MQGTLLLETKRLRLSPVHEDDAQLLCRMFNMQPINHYFFDDDPMNADAIEALIRESERLFWEQHFGLWLLRERQNNAVVGFVGLWYFYRESQPQLLYGIVPEATRHGFATEAATCIADYAFEQLYFERLRAACHRDNQDAVRVLERMGMKFVDKRDVKGKPIVFYELSRTSFLLGGGLHSH